MRGFYNYLVDNHTPSKRGLAKPTPIKFGDGAPQTCRVDLGVEADDTPKPPQGFASQTELPAFSIPASRAIKITCGPRS